MLIDGTVVMAIGMGVVFSFLGVMVAMMNLIAFLMKPYSQMAPVKDAAVTFSAGENNPSEELAVVIAAARAFSERKQ
ncbi:MAG: OadG family protein [Candidatus Riflebacteria bacterium]|jgi:sodium pump decarboxylase gamma subunit|nr:OadG family protein [Candidatus Riflebacteria bacterium]